ncbi:hypothetical protein COS81_02055 [candidate division WWE3 bacterium CG06_land_8_20_14_3_00_42_16]|uniref:Uncharacterized protein n=4 Tax=Katanobacteria TaxID=422282 RepID=A0A2M7ANI8_UNCKA|nr:MAG: hypothetical protein AUJ38_02735 [bacterium CG1_02_42_9]PIU68948.1 MAG: hypothetical protein COS81_02055 [candidate division WWE3 bacterium CG06_land_8_20_14_3_00_42_16]PIZ43926.1 MAG: hypothetical protein COY34_00085 [candidate division WWE3 bacterium CG_4_10_14_0_2_um_filter_42_8]PJA37365.1 MAG: hypothetical protein CO181_03815 [candidate division WWE3 bacterium CG_4_9_14_3_um_filter_43_9]PJC68909.1 MAG: hypothetical protein CO015_02300 [candidate division WWE3 bacterium CG_4_8_14_3_u
MVRIVFPLTKRRKIILVSILLTLILWFIQQSKINPALSIGVVAIVDYFLTFWVLDFDLKDQEYLALPILTILFTTAIILNIPIIAQLGFPWVVPILSFLGLYLMLLTTNILNISTVRPLPLVRAAWTALHLIYFGLSFMFMSAIFWSGFSLIQIVVFSFIIPFVLSYPAYYLLINELSRGGHPLLYMFLSGLILAEFAFVFIFLNLPFYVKSISLGAVFYIVTGILEHDLRANMSKETATEYIAIALLVIAAIFYHLIFF